MLVELVPVAVAKSLSVMMAINVDIIPIDTSNASVSVFINYLCFVVAI